MEPRINRVTLDELFPARVCINLDRRPERWQRVEARFAEHGIDGVRRFPALDGNALPIPLHWRHTAGAYGCLRSHLQVVKDARRLGLPSVLIFEDDVVFDSDLQSRFALGAAQLPGDWDMLFFGALHKDEPIPLTESLCRLTRSNSTYAYAIRNTVFDAFIDLNERAEDVLDNNSFRLQQRFHCLCFMPHLAWVENDWSDAQTKIEGHWYLKESLVLFGSGADRLLADTVVVLAHDGSEAANVEYLARYYAEFFGPQIALILVEQSAHATVDATTLPPNCEYVFFCHETFDRERCFAEGIRHSSDRRFAILSDSDIYLETLDIRANLRMCERYASATGFSGLIDLSAEESLRLRTANTTRGLTTAVPSRAGRPGVCRFINRSLQATSPFQVFESPNHALRLSGGALPEDESRRPLVTG
jgi:GR25 family glycosyltransferase involved in LPS biosynthesis